MLRRDRPTRNGVMKTRRRRRHPPTRSRHGRLAQPPDQVDALLGRD